MSSEFEQHVAEIRAYGYTIIEGGNKDFQKHLKMVKDISQIADSTNKSLHADRAKDHVIYNLQNKHVEFVKLLSNPLVQEVLGVF